MERNGQTWLDSESNPIQAHGGGALFHEGFYYWYGENRAGQIIQINGKSRPAAVGVSCYRSRDLLSWQNLGVVLPAVQDDPAHDLASQQVIERPKVIYNAGTKRFTMWLHIDSPDYKAARVGVAVSDDPAGPFRYLQSFRPNGFESRDQTVYQDSDGVAYHVCATDMNSATLISRLRDDYLSLDGQHVKVMVGRDHEAFAVCKRDGRYWMLMSGCSGWAPNTARLAVADGMTGPWQELGNPCVGENADKTFGGQSAFILQPQNPHQPHIAMFDLWRPNDLKASGYIWLPMEWTAEGQSRIPWRDAFGLGPV